MISNTAAAAALLSPVGESGRYTGYTNSISIVLSFYAIIFHRPPDRTESFLLDTLRVSITSEAGE